MEAQNKSIKDFLLKNNDYTPELEDEDFVLVKESQDKLKDLYVIESSNYATVDVVRDLLGDVHSFSYKFRPRRTATAKYRLGKKYDVFDANIVTTADTGDGVKMRLEIYLDDDLVKNIDNITRSTNSMKLGPVSVRGGETLTIKAITLEGDDYYSNLFLCEDSLSTIE